MRRLKSLVVKEFIQMRRDPLTLVMLMLIPIVQLVLFGFAINTDVKHLPTIVFDRSMGQESREFVQSLAATQYFDIRSYASSFDDIRRAIERGECVVGIAFGPDFAKRLARRDGAEIQVIVDASDPMSASSAISAAEMTGIRKSVLVLSRMAGTGEPKIWDIRVRPWYNRDFKTPYYMVPGILGVILTMTMLMITSMAIVRERERGTLEQLLVTPMRPWELMVGKVVPYLGVGYAQLTIGLAIGRVVFDIPVRGSLGLLYLLTLLFICSTLVWGILISTVSKTQMQAMILSVFGFLPSILLSGFMFPRMGMPKIFQYLSMALPLTWFQLITRGILLKGVGAESLVQPIVALCALILLFLAVSLLKFRRTLD
jgi:ABC-2 type transport system permease protein